MHGNSPHTMKKSCLQRYEDKMELFGQGRHAPSGSTYRSVIINGLNKMVYRIDGDIIYVVDFWDTRREPVSQAVQTD